METLGIAALIFFGLILFGPHTKSKKKDVKKDFGDKGDARSDREKADKKGFTLIELLVVISIVALLSSIVLASTNVVREKARIAAGQKFAQSLHNVLGSEAAAIWNFDEGSGTTAKDTTNLGHNGTLFDIGAQTHI